MSLARTFALLASAALLTLGGCGPTDLDTTAGEEPGEASAAVACAAYLLDNTNYSGPLAPFPINGMGGGPCINLIAASDNRTSSFRITCPTRFFDGPNCTGTVYSAPTSGVMPVWFDNRTTSIKF
jgi:hypothetical protein